MFKTYFRKQADIPNASVQRDKVNTIWTLKADWRIMENILFQIAKKPQIIVLLMISCFFPLSGRIFFNVGFFLL